jgi:hypothetical protein
MGPPQGGGEGKRGRGEEGKRGRGEEGKRGSKEGALIYIFNRPL